MSRAFSSIKRTFFAAAGVVAGMALGTERQLSMGTMEAWTWVEVPGVAWSAWETRVESAAEGLAESARWVPPMPRGAVAYLGQGVEEWPTALAACMEVVSPSVTVGGVPAWEVRVTEWVGEDGARQWVTHCGGMALHAQTVPAGFDPEAWSLAVYTEDGALPDFIAGDPTRRAEWFENRGRERLGFSYTFVAAGQVEAFQAALDAEEAARLEELEKAAQEGEELPWVFAVREMKPTAGTMAFALCNPDGADVDVLGKPELTEPWEYVGRVETERRRWATFGLPMGPDGKEPLYFWKFLDATRDSDGDGIPDGMEVAYFETNPMKADTAGSMIDDWRKIYLYGMDATIADADGDGLPDGWEVLNGLDPYSGEGANGATGDLDGDGVSNALELAYGTNPGVADSDGDGLQDRTEMGWATVFAKRGPAVLGGERRAVADGGEMAFPFAVRLGGRRYDRVRVSRAGTLTLEGPAPLTIRLWEGPVTWEETWLAGIFAEVGTWQEKPAMALSFENFGLSGEDSGTLGRVQVLFVEGEGAVEVRYTTLQGKLVQAKARARRPDGRFVEMLSAEASMGDAVRFDFGFGSDPMVADTDGDGMADGEEVAVGRSAPGPDDDFDGLPDVWERLHGLDPLVDDGASDPDGDGLDSLTEYRLGTNPTATDSDGDGLNDADEVGDRVTRRSGLPPMDVSDVTEWVSFAGKKEDGWVYLDLPAVVTIGGVAYPRVAYHADGLLAFVPAGVADLADPGEPQPLADALLDPRFPTFALYWADLALVPDYLSQVRAGVLGDRVVIECLNLAKERNVLLWPTIEPSSTLARIQVSVPREVGGGIEVRYPTLQGEFDASDAIIGAQPAGGRGTELFAVGNKMPRAVIAGDALTYHFSLGTDPARADTDGDGLNDSAELDAGLNAFEPDTDGDGMSDGWEHLYGYDPTTQNNGDWDRDGDGLKDKDEAAYGTNPYDSDSDGDGVKDKVEIGQSSDPSDATDGGVAESRVKVSFYFGDDSGSHSEKYALEITQLVGEGGGTKILRNEEYGKCETHTLFLRPDSVYAVTMRHVATAPDKTVDRDYTLKVEVPIEASSVLVEDPDRLQGVYGVENNEPFPGEGKTIFIYNFDAKLVPDYDRDRVMDGNDIDSFERGVPLQVWPNLDTDFEKEKGINDGSDLSYTKLDERFEKTDPRNAMDGWVNGQSDMEDFFPMQILLGDAVKYFLSEHSSATFGLSCSLDEAANVLWCHGDATIVERFYNGDDTTSAQCFGEDGDKVAWEADMAWLYKTPLTCPEGVLKQLQEGEAYCFIETCTIGPLSISLSLMDESIEETNEDGIRIAACGLESLQPEARYSVIDLRSNTLTSRVSEEDVNVFFVHGYNVSESGSMAWCNTIFKRLWQSGMNVRFYGVTWNGDEQSGLPDYYTNVVNAFNAAEAFANVMRNVPGKKIVMAHSLGNMVVSSAIQDHEAPVDVYFMLNSAVPAEAYDTEAPTYDFSIDGVPEWLIHDAWDAYPPKSYAALWHRHFLPHEGFLPMAADEARAQLTWKGRFKDVLDNRGVEVYNFYSAGDGTQSGDEVFELAEMTPRPTSGFGWVWWNPIRPLVDIVSDNVILGRHSWQKQECWKGRGDVSLFAFMTSDKMGWGFEEPQKTNEDTEKMSDEDFRKSPIFCRNPQTVFGDDAQPILEQRDLLLSSAIPAMSEATGRSFLSGIDDSRQIDCQDIYVDSRHSVQWVNRVERLGKRWLHSDVKNVAYPFVKGLFDEIVKQGGLK